MKGTKALSYFYLVYLMTTSLSGQHTTHCQEAHVSCVEAHVSCVSFVFSCHCCVVICIRRIHRSQTPSPALLRRTPVIQQSYSSRRRGRSTIYILRCYIHTTALRPLHHQVYPCDVPLFSWKTHTLQISTSTEH